MMASVVLKSTLDDLAAKFESGGGGKVTMVYGLSAELKWPTMSLLIRPMMEDLLKQGTLAAGSLSNVGGTPVTIAIRTGAPKPDIDTVEALKDTLIAAESISYAEGAASGVYFAKSRLPAYSHCDRQHDGCTFVQYSPDCFECLEYELGGSVEGLCAPHLIDQERTMAVSIHNCAKCKQPMCWRSSHRSKALDGAMETDVFRCERCERYVAQARFATSAPSGRFGQRSNLAALGEKRSYKLRPLTGPHH